MIEQTPFVKFLEIRFRMAQSFWSQEPQQAVLRKEVSCTFHMSIRRGSRKANVFLKTDTLTLSRGNGLINAVLSIYCVAALEHRVSLGRVLCAKHCN